MKKVFFVSGETSGDQQGAKLIREIKTLNPQVRCLGMGGDAMKEAGMEIVVHSADMALVGILEVLVAWRRVLNAFQTLKQRLYEEKPDLVILIDYPGFNLRFAKLAKKAGCKVLYYIAPQIWAWGEGRVRIMQRYVDQVCVVFPFEVEFYRQHNVKAHFVGHPLTNRVRPVLSREEGLKYFNLKDEYPIVGLLPGSRKVEIKYLLPAILEVARLIKQKYPTAQFILPAAPHVDKENLMQKLEPYQSLNIILTPGSLYDALSLCDVAVAASGTVTLECGLLELPTIILYKLNFITAWIARKMAKHTILGICNILTKESVMKEFIQEDVIPEKIFQEIQYILDNTAYRNEIKGKLKKVREILNAPQTSGTGGNCVIHLLES